jgi:L,D-transpeptidase ErfK/SrfK
MRFRYGRFTAWLLPACVALCFASPVRAATYALVEGQDFIGEYAETTATAGDTLIDIAQRHGLGFEEIVNANPGMDPWLPRPGARVRLPARRVLPPGPREGIVINLPEHRLYYFPPARAGLPRSVTTYPVSIGKMDWRTPIGTTRVVAKIKDPPWYPPKSVRDEHARRGDILPAVVPAGPDNPLGRFALRLGITGGSYLIHGTNNPAGVGMQVTHGCMRLYPVDIEALFAVVPVDTPVRIVNEPFKIGWGEGIPWIEVHPPLQEDAVAPPSLSDMLRVIVAGTTAAGSAIDWQRAMRAWREHRGIPEAIALSASDRLASR